ncbi:hypothetical protein BAE44_0009894 [Dichanthelium oligosanthes]|uniref:NB-ARC domain-containing protein n=1 Tax=Dichanthelium oligosanthes TaxID=888268 RepID=A0A1E5VVD8_9POAL|nr:hypothetical protein BAE44_0009894 [Dichanthelium oligosanthes]
MPLLLANVISARLKDKTFFLLLDGVRDGIDLAAIGLPMPLGHRQKVVFTTRDQAVCANMGCAAGDSSIQMQCLREDVAWDLFRYYVGDEIVNANSVIEGLAKEMVAECRASPCTVGRSMANQRCMYQWRVAYDMLRIKRPLPSDIQEMTDEGYPCLQYFENEF